MTVTGTIIGEGDGARIFQAGKEWNDLPFELVFHFADKKGVALRPNESCPSGGSGINSMPGSNPGKAVLTVNGKSYEFGKKPDARSRFWRSIATYCSASELGMAVQEDPDPLTSGVNILIRPKSGQRPQTGNGDWHSGVTLTNFDARNGYNSFAIRRPWELRCRNRELSLGGLGRRQREVRVD